MKDPADESAVPADPGSFPHYEDEEGGPVKPFLDHLEDLRWVLIKCLIVFGISFILCIAFTNRLVDILESPLEKATGAAIVYVDDSSDRDPVKGDSETGETSSKPARSEGIIVTTVGVTGAFTVALQLGLWGGLCLSFPFLLYILGDYVIPALRKNEKKYLGVAFTSGTVLFAMGGLMAYFFVAPISLKAFISLGNWMGIPAVVWTAESYFGFVPKLVLGMGLAFEVPIVVLTLVKLNIVSAEFLVTGRKYMVIANLVLSAFITPQDIVSTVMLAAPLQILFEICIIIARHWDKQEKKKLRAMGFEV